MKRTEREIVLVLDFGSQYVQLLAQRVRENQTYCEIVPCDISVEELASRAPIGIILSGGPSSVNDSDAPKVDPRIFKLGVPVLGVCYGMQATCAALGATVERAERREYGPAESTLTSEGKECALFAGIGSPTRVWASHGDQVAALPPGFVVLASTPTCPNAAVQCSEANFYGVQFHPEVVHSVEGGKIIANFVGSICGSSRSWTPKNFVETAIASIRARVGEDRVVCGLSGGVDSTVVAALVSRAIGSRLTCIFVDNGMMRKNEIEDVENAFRDNFDFNLVVARAENRFLDALAGISDPQEKRKIIGKTFIDVFSEEAKKIDGAKFLAQGTIYPDVIESGGKKGGQAAVIKLHHNVGGLPDDLEFELIEPLRELF